jgi:DNA relaxase NicK
LDKSRPKNFPKQGDTLYFGNRTSSKLVRCYEKSELGCFRVELQLNSRFLRRFPDLVVGDLATVVQSLYPNHLQFVNIAWPRLDRRLTMIQPGMIKLLKALRRKKSLHEFWTFLRQNLELSNLDPNH